jgi:hypothetical protein
VVNRPSVPEIITVNSESLQTQIRDLLPSQNGFGSELQASNVITPIIDLTRAAEGSTVPELLQTALAYGSQTSFRVTNTTSTLVNTTGFYRVFGCATNKSSSSTDEVKFELTDGVTPKVIWSMEWAGVTGLSFFAAVPYDFVVFLRAGDSLTATSDSTNGIINGSTRQIADSEGALLNPSGFPV